MELNKNRFSNILILILTTFLIISLNLHIGFAKELTFIVKEFKTGKDIKSGLVDIIATSDSIRKEFHLELNNNSLINLDLDNRTWDFIITIDDDKTPSYDYYVKHHVEQGWPDKPQSIYLFPVGGVNVRVEDINGNLISNADVKIECLENRFIKINSKTDFFGTFSNEFIPVGNCSAFASFNDAAGITSFTTKKGKMQNVIVTLDKKVVSSTMFLKNNVLVFALIVALLTIAYLLRKKTKKAKQKDNAVIEVSQEIKLEHNPEQELVKEKETQTNVIPAKLDQVMKTLSEKEKRVVEYLLASNFSSKSSKIRYDLRISKTTFSRVLKSLESKNIILIENQTKPVKIKINPEYI
ncbi:MAG: hypothetical protein PWR32_359 [Candidatus Woesearchaeota archaeon]|nr:hypothetical protein [Candidatus Woesearchaeota archaeon]